MTSPETLVVVPPERVARHGVTTSATAGTRPASTTSGAAGTNARTGINAATAATGSRPAGTTSGATGTHAAAATGTPAAARVRRRRRTAVVDRAARLVAASRQLVSFGAIGLLCFAIDLGVYNLLRLTVLDDEPIAAKVGSAVVSTAVAWVLNRFITFRSERTTGRRDTVREGVLFAVTNLIGLGIAAACLFVSHYLLGFTSTLADNVAGNGVGLVLGTAFRFAAYKTLVFRSPDARRTKEHAA